MTRQEEVLSELRGLLGQILVRKGSGAHAAGVDERASLMRDLGIDSLDLLQLVAAVEKKYDIRFSDRERGNLDNLGALVRATLRRLDGA